MPVEQVLVTLDPETDERARRAADREGIPLSTWLERAVRAELDRVGDLGEE
ncbi:hypothetical protein [Nocardiopsis oceani]